MDAERAIQAGHPGGRVHGLRAASGAIRRGLAPTTCFHIGWRWTAGGCTSIVVEPDATATRIASAAGRGLRGRCRAPRRGRLRGCPETPASTNSCLHRHLAELREPEIFGEAAALKVVEKHPLAIRNMLPQLQREVRIQGAIQHPRVLRLLSCVEDEHYVYMLLEYCAGGSLRNLSTRLPGARFPEVLASKYFAQILQGVDFLHSCGCIHRDLKPDNILLNHADEVRICDFGWSAEVRAERALRTTCGTPSYWAPEIFEGQPQSAPVDLWALGNLVYELLVGHPPFWGNSEELRAKVLSVDLRFPPGLLSREAINVMYCLLQRDPWSRVPAGRLLAEHPWVHAGVLASPPLGPLAAAPGSGSWSQPPVQVATPIDPVSEPELPQAAAAVWTWPPFRADDGVEVVFLSVPSPLPLAMPLSEVPSAPAWSCPADPTVAVPPVPTMARPAWPAGSDATSTVLPAEVVPPSADGEIASKATHGSGACDGDIATAAAGDDVSIADVDADASDAVAANGIVAADVEATGTGVVEGMDESARDQMQEEA
eukprot:TRINITY_DN20709_c1_g5_i1.p1 TRINITY_DN20709_c1_g5~~TRINITY_DN20709_c1_g5_i1.p1  ORF type:complete len:566 (-),score=79.11 TRINITY_DN20709_c1_g5_i1:20-1645(-)